MYVYIVSFSDYDGHGIEKVFSDEISAFRFVNSMNEHTKAMPRFKNGTPRQSGDLFNSWCYSAPAGYRIGMSYLDVDRWEVE